MHCKTLSVLIIQCQARFLCSPKVYIRYMYGLPFVGPSFSFPFEMCLGTLPQRRRNRQLYPLRHIVILVAMRAMTNGS
jgi:hypothetical protein